MRRCGGLAVVLLRAWLLLDSRVVDVPMVSNSTFAVLSPVKPLFFNNLKMGYASRTTREHTPPESNKSVCGLDFQILANLPLRSRSRDIEESPSAAPNSI